MAEVVWAEPALADLRAIYAYIARDAPAYAAGMLRTIVAAAGRLREFPASGRRVPEMPRRRVREIVIPPYRLIYRRATGKSLIVLAVIHASRDLRRALRGRSG